MPTCPDLDSSCSRTPFPTPTLTLVPCAFFLSGFFFSAILLYLEISVEGLSRHAAQIVATVSSGGPSKAGWSDASVHGTGSGCRMRLRCGVPAFIACTIQRVHHQLRVPVPVVPGGGGVLRIRCGTRIPVAAGLGATGVAHCGFDAAGAVALHAASDSHNTAAALAPLRVATTDHPLHGGASES